MVDAAQMLAAKISNVFLTPSSVFWAPTLLSALLIAALSLSWARLRTGRRVRPAALIKTLFPAGLLRSPSTKADVGLFLFNAFPAGLLVGAMILSADQFSAPVTGLLVRAFGPSPAISPPPGVKTAIITVALYLAYEFGYWLDHYLSHKIPMLWEFHKVHHTAEVLSPLTVFRVHPVDTLVFLNILSVVVGGVSGVLHYVFDAPPLSAMMFGMNVFLIAFTFLTVHLQHSHIWISFPGVLGRILLSPAHHQVHHSDNPIHFDKNFGSCLSVWDWAFGTLYVPGRHREPLRFGVHIEAGKPSPHSVTGTLISPFAACLGLVRRACGRAQTDATPPVATESPPPPASRRATSLAAHP
ncbi:MAG: sterol desaturase family protein [Phenylobacterium sp.]|nr:sterol desaturase family protein [Phenylobacterium sp.]